MFGSFLPSPLAVSASKVYSGLGADIVYGIITLIIPVGEALGKLEFEYDCAHQQFNLSVERDQMADLGAVLEQLKQERAKLDRAIAALSGVIGGKSGGARSTGKRRLSAAARKRIADAQRARWAKFKAKKRA